MENDISKGQERVFTNKVKAGKRRTYFIDVRKTKSEDFYITLTESTKRFNGDGYSRHKIYLYKEDFNRFMEGLQEAIDHVKNDLMPDYDYEQFDRKHQEWDSQQDDSGDTSDASTAPPSDSMLDSEEDIDW